VYKQAASRLLLALRSNVATCVRVCLANVAARINSDQSNQSNQSINQPTKRSTNQSTRRIFPLDIRVFAVSRFRVIPIMIVSLARFFAGRVVLFRDCTFDLSQRFLSSSLQTTPHPLSLSFLLQSRFGSRPSVLVGRSRRLSLVL